MLKIDHESVEYGSASKEPGCHLMKSILGLSLLLIFSISTAVAEDCNGNGVDDAVDIQTTSFAFTAHESVYPSYILDINGDGLVDDVSNILRLTATFMMPEFKIAIQQRDGSYIVRDYLDSISAAAWGPFPARANLNGFVDFVESGPREGGIVLRNNGAGMLASPVDLGNVAVTRIEAPNNLKRLDDEVLRFSPDDFADRIEMRSAESFELFVASTASGAVSKGVYSLPAIGSQGDLLEVEHFGLSRDFNADGINDLLLVRKTSRGERGGGTTASVTGYLFAGRDDNRLDENSRTEVLSESFRVTDGRSIFQIAFPDRNNDSYLDILVARTGTLPRVFITGSTVYLNNANAPFPDKDGNQIPDICQRAIPGDYSGDRISNEVVVRSAFGGLDWYISDEVSNSPLPLQFGLSGPDVPMPGDFNGDGRYSPGVVRDWFGGLYWYYRSPEGQAMQRQWGLSGDLPLTGYFDADRSEDLAVVRNLGGFLFWYLTPFDGISPGTFQWGLAGDRPFAADWDGDGVDELIVARNQGGAITWYVRNLSGSLVEVVPWGLSGDEILAPADMDGDGRADLLVSRPQSNLSATYIRFADASSEVKVFGLASDRKFVGYYSGKAVGELGVYRATQGALNQFYIQRDPSTRFRTFGFAGDAIVTPSGD